MDSWTEHAEIEWLKGRGLDPSSLDELLKSEAKKLTTRMVPDWRAKQDEGRGGWLGRAQYVAREFSWLEDCSDIFAHASSALLNRLLLIL